jgi:hypothetical protein
MQIAPTSSDKKPPIKPRTALQREASRQNGKRSKGPKTPEGKARSSRNARRHGRSVPAIADPAFHEQIRAFAREIAGPSGDAAVRALAILIAAAHIDAQRARHAACALMSGMKPGCPATKAVHRLDWIKRCEHRRGVCRDKAMQQLDEWLIAAGGRAENCETNPAAGSIQVDEARRAEAVHAATGSENGEHHNWLLGNLKKRTRECPASSDKTNLTAEKRAAVRAELSSWCNRARAGMKKRTRAMPPRRWKVVRSTERSATRIHCCKMNPSWRASIRPGRRRHIRAAIPGIAHGYRSRASGSNRVFRLLH